MTAFIDSLPPLVRLVVFAIGFLMILLTAEKFKDGFAQTVRPVTKGFL